MHARSGNDFLFDGFLQVHIGVAGALGFQVADGGEPVLQRTPGGLCCHNCPVGSALLQQLLVIVRRGDVPLQQHVGVRVNQSREAGAIREIKHRRAGGRRSALPHLADAVAFDNDYDIAPRLWGNAINEHSATERGYWR